MTEVPVSGVLFSVLLEPILRCHLLFLWLYIPTGKGMGAARKSRSVVHSYISHSVLFSFRGFCLCVAPCDRRMVPGRGRVMLFRLCETNDSFDEYEMWHNFQRKIVSLCSAQSVIAPDVRGYD